MTTRAEKNGLKQLCKATHQKSIPQSTPAVFLKFTLLAIDVVIIRVRKVHVPNTGRLSGAPRTPFFLFLIGLLIPMNL
jgi:hypothetical protein